MEVAMGRGQQRAAKVRRRKAVVKNRHEAVADRVRAPLDGGIDAASYKLSEALLALAAPFRPEDEDLELFEKAVSLAVTAWNLSLFSAAGRQEQIDKLLADKSLMKDPMTWDKPVGSIPSRSDFRDVLYGLIARKDVLYPRDRRLVMKINITEKQNEYNLQVLSKLLPDSSKDE